MPCPTETVIQIHTRDGDVTVSGDEFFMELDKCLKGSAFEVGVGKLEVSDFVNTVFAKLLGEIESYSGFHRLVKRLK